MRLLRMEEDGDVSLREYVGENIPPYAILSHRWGKDDEEVTFQDIMENRGRNKPGYAKIRSCGEQAARNNLEHFWVDTCCIDKTSSAELSESINSMWHWYRNSRICYAYLDDVLVDLSTPDKYITLASSMWFTRGWTLQELLAPSRLVLYDTAWEVIGTKHELATEISKITNIDKGYLTTDTSLLEQASIAERMSWASARMTKRFEDAAYCLLGIFDINMPLLYGEGTKAFQRLQEEIVKRSDDQSIFAWNSLSWNTNHCSLLARSPADFKACGNIIKIVQGGPTKPYAITNKGLQIDLPLVRKFDHRLQRHQLHAVLNCRYRNDTFANLALPLHEMVDKHRYQRHHGELKVILSTDWAHATVQSMYISMTPSVIDSTDPLEDNTCIVRNLANGCEISQVFPSDRWSRGVCTFEGNRNQVFPQDPNNRTLIVVTSGRTHHFLIMTFLRKNRFFHDWVWDARLLPTPFHDNSDIEYVFSEWKHRDLSILPRVQESYRSRVALRTVPQLIQGRRLTIVDVIWHNSDPFLPGESSEQAIEVLRSGGYRLSRVIYWVYKWSFKNLQKPIDMLMLVLVLGCFANLVYEMRKQQSLGHRIGNIALSLFFLVLNLSKFLGNLRRNRALAQSDVGSLGWQDNRDHDVWIGVGFILLLPILLLFTLLGLDPIWSFVALSFSVYPLVIFTVMTILYPDPHGGTDGILGHT